ncbi:hypothetical protein [Paenibacillus harenae]|uniref:hypothetical protein n=1 Tax=Paenibacillus harenae TaxID=306543 RepID=UPI002790BD34|nr:hypothetical protein [Paenibacillus harenae]MDQ0059472.1 hypothetical protein [Paenibacillus harenae]
MSTKKRYMAFLDILGFKSIMGNLSTDELGDQMSHILQASILSAIKGDTVFVDNNPSLEVSSSIKVYQFSDSIIMYTEDDDIGTFIELIKALNLLLAQSIIRGFPLRGALTWGDMYVNGSIIVGDPLVRASVLESRQEWSGVIVDCPIDTQIMIQMLDEKVIAQHEVTLKDENDSTAHISEHRLVINWPQHCGIKVGSADNLVRSMTRFSGYPTRQKEIDKIQRTVDFYKENIGNKALPNFSFGDGKVMFNEDGEPLFIPMDRESLG